MKIDKLVGERFKERTSECVIDSHSIMLRGGYMKYMANGIYSLYTPLRRVTKKIEQIIREEMDALDGQEVLFPVVLPASLWEESGRITSVGSELLRLKDRNGSSLVLGMTHEEAAVHLAREYGVSYQKYPFMIYQIQTKFRDDARPRGGLIRVREFTMKDAYSFHTSLEDLSQYYDRCAQAYNRIFIRVGLPEVVSVISDSGMMGGNVSCEYMLLTAIGENSIALCSECNYRSNMEAAECIVENSRSDVMQELKLIYTPSIQSINDVCGFLSIPMEKSCKAVVYQKKLNDQYIVLFIRGDLEINEIKLENFLNEEVYPAVITDDCGLLTGYIGPYNINGEYTVLFDKSLEGAYNLCCGANISEYHYTGLNIERDYGAAEYHDFAKITEGGICPACGKSSVTIKRGIELGHIFQLGNKYTKVMNMQYQDRDGNLNYPLMGCYGIGIGRLAASVCEARHDEFGPIWPMSIAPWQVHICCVRADDHEIKKYADSLYDEMIKRGIEALYDDRAVSAGFMFSDADLIGVPLRVIISPRNMKENCCEIVSRDKTLKLKTPLSEVITVIESLIHKLLER